ncbi:MAG: DUF881 domain-containing protein [Romboutsia sp.]
MYKTDKNIKQKMVILGAFILGILIPIYLKSLNPSSVYITLEEKKDMESEIQYKKNEIQKLKYTLSEQKATLRQYKDVLKDEDTSIKDLMEEEISYFKALSGYVKVQGEGIVVTIIDSEKNLENGQNPNDLIVHDIDILRILNDLKKSGAEAISINAERVLSTSKIKCSGATITVNETTYGQPFVIKAIGDVNILKASMISPESYANLLKEVYGIYIKIEEKSSIIINYHEKSI